MEKHWLERTNLLIGEENLEKLKETNVLIVGLGGVGSFAAEFIVRSGIGKITLVDGDTVDITNINRQLQALHSTIGQEKATLLETRLKDINPACDITAINHFLNPANMTALLQANSYDYALDCIDSIQPKITMIRLCKEQNQAIICSMGAGGKLDPSKIKVADIGKTKECKFAQQVRKELKKHGIKDGVTTVYSEEIQPRSALKHTDGSNFKKSFYGTISYMPALFGLTMAAELIQRIIGNKYVA